MDIALINSLKRSCQGELAELINSSYLTIESEELNIIAKGYSVLFLEIYTPSHLIHQLYNYEDKLEEIAKELGLDFIQIMLLDLGYHFSQAKSQKTIAAWKKYLELQYLV